MGFKGSGHGPPGCVGDLWSHRARIYIYMYIWAGGYPPPVFRCI